MTSYLIRRIFQMILVVFFAALFTYFLFNISPGGPMVGFQQQVRRVTRQDIARVRAQYELDLYWPTRFARWLVGFPTGPITVGGRELFATVPVGCYLPRDEQVVINENGEKVTVPPGATNTFTRPISPRSIRQSRAARASCGPTSVSPA